MKLFCYTLLFIVCLSATACKEKYELPEAVVNKDYLVVEGFIDGGNDSTFIRLSRTVTPNDTNRIKTEVGARVSIESENGDNFLLHEIQPGVYALAPLLFDPSAKYRLAITAKGKSYLSDYVEIKKTPVIDSVNWTREPNGVQVYVNTHDTQNKTQYYNWQYHETWEFHTYYSNWEYVNYQMVPRTHPELIFECWQSHISSHIIIGSSAKLSEDIIYNYPIAFIPDDSWKIESRYSILVKQNALSQGAYEYLENMKKNSEQLGSIFDPQPSTSNGNIHCISDPKEIVLGYLYSSTTVEKRIFITRSEVPGWKYRFSCAELFVPLDSLLFYFGGDGLLPTRQEIRPTDQKPGYVGSEKYCVDCTVTGTNVKPDFW
ncbi:MAG TPA: DUF4249 domain-containing protein [Agriterribacter sp.]|nr:DUF4249 domain-containing protein [Agriterribacter sp.]